MTDALEQRTAEMHALSQRKFEMKRTAAIKKAEAMRWQRETQRVERKLRQVREYTLAFKPKELQNTPTSFYWKERFKDQCR